MAAKPRNLTPLDPTTLRLSVLVPVYNELHTIETILARVHSTPFAKEIICVDDCSTDGTRERLIELREEGYIDNLILQQVNGGKGRAIRTADTATGACGGGDAGLALADVVTAGCRTNRLAAMGAIVNRSRSKWFTSLRQAFGPVRPW